MSQLLVIRHGIAGDADEFAATGRSDDERPLTEKGSREMKRVGAGLRALVKKIDLLTTSPLVRARQTAVIVAGAFDMPIGEVTEVLRPTASLETFADWASATSASGVLAIVGHDPHLSRLVTWLVSGVDAPRIALKKGGACLLEFDATPAPSAGTLLWLLKPAQLIAASQ